MVKRKHLSIGLLCLLPLVACSSFPYKYYGMELPSYEGTLLGPEPEDDLPFKECAPDEITKGKCVVMFIAEFELLKMELEELRARLKACE